VVEFLNEPARVQRKKQPWDEHTMAQETVDASIVVVA
jgi:hypothetical protein